MGLAFDAAAGIERESKRATEVVRAMADTKGVRCEVRVAEGDPNKVMAGAGLEFDADILVVRAPKTGECEARPEALRQVRCPVLPVRE